MRIVAAVASAAVLLSAGCGQRNNALGAGPDTDACDAYSVYDRFFGEPSPRNRDELLAHADGTIRLVDRVRGDFKISVEDKDDFVPDQSVMDAWAAIKRSMEAFRAQVEGAGRDPEKLRFAAHSLSADADFLAADAKISDFSTNQCPRRA